MAKRIAYSQLNASTLDILNVIRENASYEYQSSVPTISSLKEIPKVGEIICGTPALANQFVNALINRIALVAVRSATFNNPYSHLKKGYLEFGETVEEVFVDIIKAIVYDPDKAPERELKQYYPNVRSAFHVINWRVMYPITIRDDELARAFVNADGLSAMVAKIVEAIYIAAAYDEFLLFKYLLIKSVAHGKMYPVGIDVSKDANSAIAFRGMSNKLEFMNTLYNEAGVMNNTKKEKQAIFMDADYNAQYDVNVLSAAFNMDKAEFMGRLHLIDDFTTFDNSRFDVIRSQSDGLESVTAAELTVMGSVKAILIDEEWFQIYDNLEKMTENYLASALGWNYFYHVWKIISHSPFANAVVFVDSSATFTLPDTISATVTNVETGDTARVVTLEVDISSTGSLKPNNVIFVQTTEMTEELVGVQRYGAFLYPMPASGHTTSAFAIEAKIGETNYSSDNNTGQGVAKTLNLSTCAVGDTITLTKES